jgi:hypothetical protein
VSELGVGEQPGADQADAGMFIVLPAQSITLLKEN